MPSASGERAPHKLQAHPSAAPADRRSPPGRFALIAHGVSTLLCVWGASLFLLGWWREAQAADEHEFWALPTFAAAALVALAVRYVVLLAAVRNAAVPAPRRRRWLRAVDIAARTAMCLACLAVIWAAHSLPTRASGDVDVLFYGAAWVASLLCAYWQLSHLPVDGHRLRLRLGHRTGGRAGLVDLRTHLPLPARRQRRNRALVGLRCDPAPVVGVPAPEPCPLTRESTTIKAFPTSSPEIQISIHPDVLRQRLGVEVPTSVIACR